jgi:hypothetical protein
MPLEELVDKYAAAYDVDFELPSSPESFSSSDSHSSDGKHQELNIDCYSLQLADCLINASITEPSCSSQMAI